MELSSRIKRQKMVARNSDSVAQISWLDVPHMRYESEYAWLILVSTMDIMLTWVILFLGGTEVNPIANAVVQAHGYMGLVFFKYPMMLFVIVMCEVIGREKDHVGHRLSRVAIGLSSIPVVWSLTILLIASWNQTLTISL